MGEIFHGLNFRSWSHPQKFAATKFFCHLESCSIEKWLLSSKKKHWKKLCVHGYHIYNDMGNCCWRNAGLRERVEERLWPWYAKSATVCLYIAEVAFRWTNCIRLRSDWAQCLFSCTGPPNSDSIPRLHFISIPWTAAVVILGTMALQVVTML